MPRPIALAALMLCSLAGLAGGCGDGSAAGGDDPASGVPRDAALYVEAVVRPEGSVREDALAAAAKLLRTEDPAARIEQLVEQVFAESGREGGGPALDYGRDVKPWLGERAGFWLAAGHRHGGEPAGAAILAASDTDAAQAAIDRAARDSGRRFTTREHGGVEYQAGGDGAAAGVVEDFAVFGSEAEVKRTIDALDGESLAGEDRYADAVGELSDERLAHFYLDARRLIDQAVRADPDAARQLEQVRRVFPVDRLGTVTGAFTADGDRLAVDVATSAEGGELFERFGALTGTGATPLLGEMPGDSWFAVGSPKLGETLRTLYGQVAGALGGAAIEQQLRSDLGVDLQRDVFSWIGDAALFARGASEDDLDGAAVIAVTDRERAASAFGKLIGLLQTRGGVRAQATRVEGAEVAFELREPGWPKPVVAARSSDRVVIAYGAAAATDALSSGEKLSDGETFTEAREQLGDDLEPAYIVEMPSFLALAESGSGGDPDFQRARPYLDALSLLTSGGRFDGDRYRARFVAALK